MKNVHIIHFPPKRRTPDYNPKQRNMQNQCIYKNWVQWHQPGRQKVLRVVWAQPIDKGEPTKTTEVVLMERGPYPNTFHPPERNVQLAYSTPH